MFALTPPAQSGQESTAPGWTSFVPLILMVVVFYFILIRPQQKKARDHASLLKTIAHGDKVITSGGILGVVVGLKEKTVSIRSADTKLEILKSSVSEIVERSSGKTEAN